jgi:hypothetical protein
MKKTIFLVSILVGLVAFHSFGQNTFPSSGNVGIGTTSPVANFDFSPVLHIKGTRPTLSLTPAAAGGLATIQFKGLSTGSEYHMNFYDNGTNSELRFGSYQVAAPILSLRGNGNVGIGTSSPLVKLDVNGAFRATGGIVSEGALEVSDYVEVGGWVNINNNLAANYIDARNNFKCAGKVAIGYPYAPYTPLADLDVKGAVVIGGLPRNGSSVNLIPGTHFMLAVKGKVYCQEVNVTPNNTANWADYVFKKDYQLSSLEEVENHIKEKGHLKDVPSAEEVTKAGYNVGGMDATLLRKIEELTLYILQQEKRIKELENRK